MAKGLITASDLANLKASGTYTKIIDNTKQSLIRPSGVVRLVPGFSKKGIFNRPVFFETGDVALAKTIYGERDRSLERKGSWFHDTLENTIQTGSVIALNLLKTNNSLDPITGEPTPNADISQHRSFSLAPNDTNGSVVTKLYSSYFNKERFWYQDERYLLANRPLADNKKLFTLANTSQGVVTAFMKKANVSGFDVTVKEWYAESNSTPPKYLKESDLISDYFVDLYVVAGDYSDYNALAIDPIYGEFFDKRGLIKDRLEEFIGLNSVNTIRYFQGAMIPNFLDKDGTIKSLDKLVNAGVDQHSLIAAFDMNEFDKFEDGNNISTLDLVGHQLINSTLPVVDFMSYKRELDRDFQYVMSRQNQWNGFVVDGSVTITPLTGSTIINVTNLHPDFANLSNNIKNGDLIGGTTTPVGLNAGITYTNPTLIVSNVVKTPTSVTFTVSNLLKELETGASGSFVDVTNVTTAISEVQAVSDQIDCTSVGATGDVVEIYVNNNIDNIKLGEYVQQAGDTTSSIIAGLIADINNGSHGYVATAVGGGLTITSPVGSGAFANDYTLTIIVTGGISMTPNPSINGTTVGVNKVDAGFQANFSNNNFYIDSTGYKYIAEKNSQIYINYESGKLVNGDIIKTTSGDVYVKLNVVRNPITFNEQLEIETFSDALLTTQVIAPIGGSTFNSDGYPIPTLSTISIVSSLVEYRKKFDVNVVSQNVVRTPIANAPLIKIGQHLVGKDQDGNKYLVRIVGIKNLPTEIEITTDGNIDITTSVSGQSQVTRFLELDDVFDRLEMTTLKGITIKDSHAPDGTNSRMREIYSVMTDTTIKNALVDPDFISFRYLVDTFNDGLEPNSKSYLAKLVKSRRKAMGILNTPSTREFSESTDPMFKDAPTPTNPLQPLKAKYIAEGGNKSMNPSFLYTLPTEEQGASYVISFYPNIGRREIDGSVISVPPAGYVSNNYVTKWRNGNGFKAMAGSQRGVLSVDGFVGLDHMLTKPERGELESAGINPLRVKNGILMIYGNQTNYHKFRSILNQANSRDTLITIETDTEDILDGFVFDNAFQDDITRTTIINSLENYYTGLRDTFGAIVSFKLKFDRENNPDWVIAANTSIIDVEIELPYVTRKFINRITLKGTTATVGSFAAV